MNPLMIRLQFNKSQKLMTVLLMVGVFLFASACSGGNIPNPLADSQPTTTNESTTAPSALLASPGISLPQLEIREVPNDIPDYDRGDWRHWVDADRDCQDARVEAMIAESSVAVVYADARECKVATGQWVDLYTGDTIAESSSVDMDHMVPLKNAHDSGGWEWDAQRREEYANYLAYDDHLIGVTASANRSKGAKGPEEWKPPANSYWCDYAIDWITIKAEWGLTANAEEWDALVDMLATCDVEVVIGGVASVPTPPPAVSLVAPGDIVITEIMPNPAAVRDSDGEWFEIYNATTVAIDINGWTIRNDGSNSHVINNGAPLLVTPNGFLVFGRSADFSINGGVPVDYQVLSRFSLTNAQDVLELVDETGAVIDRIEYDVSLVFIGTSASLNPDALDAVANDDAANWCSSETIMALGDRGTPGADNDVCE